MKKIKKKFIIYISVVIFSFILSVICFYFMSLAPVSNDNSIKKITVESGTITNVAKQLKKERLIRNITIFKLYIKLTGKNNIKASTYELSEDMGTKKIIDILLSGNSYNPDEIKITFKEGINMRKVASLIVENTTNSEENVYNLLKDSNYLDELIDKYWFLTDDIKKSDIYYPLEGYLFPDTYIFSNKDVTVKEIFTKMLDETESKLKNYKEDILKLNISVSEYFTLASIVELEGAKANDRKDVAGVFYNRLNGGWSMGSDVTTYYASKIDDFSYSLTYKELNDCSNKYNTRCESLVGLPVGPICNPSIESLEATLYPNKHEYYYFVADCKGKVYMNTDSYGHNNTINKLINEDNWCS